MDVVTVMYALVGGIFKEEKDWFETFKCGKSNLVREV
jgi:hypothetical protein